MTVAIVGLGGLGGHVAELCTRLGVGQLILIDGDVFKASNLNRQRFATETTLGLSKVHVAAQALAEINSEIHITGHERMLQGQEDMSYFAQADFIIDCLDNIPGRILLQDYSLALKIPLIHGSLLGWEGQVGLFTPDHPYMKKIYSHGSATIVEEGANLPTLPPMVAAMEVNLLIQYMVVPSECPVNQLIRFDALSGELYQINLKP